MWNTISPKLSASPWQRTITGVALLFPTLATWSYFVALADASTALQRTVYIAAKLLQFGFPVLWLLTMEHGQLRWSRPQGARVWEGLGSGALLGLSMLALYYLWLRPTNQLAAATAPILAKLTGFGVSTTTHYIAVAACYAVGHSLLEEYYWRWFVFGRLRRLTGRGVAFTLSSLGFMAHHVLVLGLYFGWASPVTWIFSLAVAGGGAIWAWQYERTGSLYGPWISHALTDAAIFLVGYDLVRLAIQ